MFVRCPQNECEYGFLGSIKDMICPGFPFQIFLGGDEGGVGNSFYLADLTVLHPNLK